MSQRKQPYRSLVVQLDNYIENHLLKAGAVNKPYKAIKRTDEYKKLQALFENGIAEQGKWASDNITNLMESAGIADDQQPLGIEQEKKLKGLLARDMPTLDSFVTEFQVFQNLKGFFEWSVKQQYKRWGYLVKSAVPFTLSNTYYINQLKDRAAYLLNKSSLDETTLNKIIEEVAQNRLIGMTNSEVAMSVSDTFEEVSRDRAEMIARTESANAIGNANHASAKENGATTHEWVAAGSNPDELCQSNEDEGLIPIDQEFPSGDLNEPAHPNCECYTQAGEIDLDSIELWTGE